jgi:lipopolysaccharide export system protein LptC
MSARAGAVLTVVVLAVAAWLLTRPEAPAPPATTGQVGDGRPIDYRITGFDVTRMTVEGRPAHRLTSPRLEHYRDDGTSRLTAPSLTVFGDAQTPAWLIGAREALLSPDGTTLTLSGDVVIERPAGATLPAMRIETQHLVVHPDTDYAETGEPVRVSSGDDWISSVGMQAWFRPPSRINFLSRVEARYVPL